MPVAGFCKRRANPAPQAALPTGAPSLCSRIPALQTCIQATGNSF
jgi:hypothetical protein